MTDQILGLIIGGLFGAGLFWSGLADPDKIIGTLRLKDFHAFRVIVVFIIVSMLGTWLLDLAGVVHYNVKPAYIISILIGGALLGIGFGLTGYCPGTGLACLAAGRIDALITVIGMFFGALVYILIYPSVAQPIEALEKYDYGKAHLWDVTVIPQWLWVVGIVVITTFVLLLTRPRKPKPLT